MHFPGLRYAQAPAASILSAQEDERYLMITGRFWRNLLIDKHNSELRVAIACLYQVGSQQALVFPG